MSARQLVLSALVLAFIACGPAPPHLAQCQYLTVIDVNKATGWTGVSAREGSAESEGRTVWYCEYKGTNPTGTTSSLRVFATEDDEQNKGYNGLYDSLKDRYREKVQQGKGNTTFLYGRSRDNLAGIGIHRSSDGITVDIDGGGAPMSRDVLLKLRRAFLGPDAAG